MPCWEKKNHSYKKKMKKGGKTVAQLYEDYRRAFYEQYGYNP